MNNTAGVLIAGAILSTVSGAVKSAKGPAQAIDDLMTLAGFGKLNELANKRRAEHQQRLDDYIHEIAEEVDKIPEEFVQDPIYSVVGPAIEASKYYIDEREIRKMFAKIIASSLDSREVTRVHTSFVEIIKQLSPLDAQHLRQIYNSIINPLISISPKEKTEKNSGTSPYISMLFKSDFATLDDYTLVSSSLTNLLRLGLIEIPFGSSYTDKNAYIELMNSKFIEDLKESLLIENPKIETDITEMIIRMTDFGTTFCQVCL